MLCTIQVGAPASLRALSLGSADCCELSSRYAALARRHRSSVCARAWWSRSSKSSSSSSISAADPPPPDQVEDSKAGEEEVEVEVTWLEEKKDELLQLTGEAVKALPGPRVGSTSVPWLLAAPAAYIGITFVIAVYRTIKKYQSPRSVKKRQIGNNLFLLESIKEHLDRQELDAAKLRQLERKSKFDSKEVLRKYIRYALNEQSFTPELVGQLIHLRKITGLADEQVAEILNDIARRVVKQKGIVMMSLEGLSAEGVQKKLAVKALFSKLLYLSEIEDFCSAAKDKLEVKKEFGVTDEDADSLRIESLSDVDSLEKMVSETDTDEPASAQ